MTAMLGTLPSMAIHERIKQARLRRRMTQEQVAEKAGVRSEQVARWESGKVTPSTKSLLKLARAMGTTLAELEGAEAPPAEPIQLSGGRLSDLDPATLRALADAIEDARSKAEKG